MKTWYSYTQLNCNPELKLTDGNSIVDRWRSISSLERAVVIVVVLVFFTFLFAQRSMNRERQKTVLRDQFHLSPTLEFSYFKPSGKNDSSQLEDTLRFSESEYHGYIASFADGNTWKAAPLRYRGVTTIGRYSAESLRWSKTKPPLRFGTDGMAHFGLYEDQKLNQLDNALHFCYAVIKIQTSPGESTPAYAAVSCRELNPREDPSVVVQGVLDPETRTLHMRI